MTILYYNPILRRRRKIWIIFPAIMFMFAALAGVAVFSDAPKAFAATLQQGANISPTSNTDFSSPTFQQSLRNLAATGANYVTLDIPLYQTNVNTTDVQDAGNTPTAASLTSAIQLAHSLGMHVMIKFSVYPGDGQWEAYINPTDRDTWFNNYQSTITPFVQLAQADGVEEICIGTELIDMSTDSSNSTNAAHWEALIAAIRGMYSGKLTYGANWGDVNGFADEKDHISWWPSLDYIGIDAYFDLSGDGSVSSLMSSWDSWNKSNIGPLQAQYGKPVLFTEIGYKSIFDSYTDPWNSGESGSPDEAQQANDYQALFEYWDQVPYFAGVQLWDWSSNPNAGGSSDTDYTPQNKTAQTIMQQYFVSASSTPPAPPVFSATANSTPGTPTVGSSITFTANVKDSGGATSGANVDFEVYNSAGHQVFQHYVTGQSFPSNSSQNYTVSWTPTSTGNYTFDVGVFSSNWLTTYYWGDSVEAFSVTASSGGGGGGGGSTSTATSTATGTINIWWPTNGVTITGVQPFKAMIPNMSVDDYSMFWQVDGGQLNTMASNDIDYPHKEASVDVTPWNWRGTGPYVVTFVAQNQSGQTIAQSSVQIFN
jgi:hypothetical protein